MANEAAASVVMKYHCRRSLSHLILLAVLSCAASLIHLLPFAKRIACTSSERARRRDRGFKRSRALWPTTAAPATDRPIRRTESGKFSAQQAARLEKIHHTSRRLAACKLLEVNATPRPLPTLRSENSSTKYFSQPIKLLFSSNRVSS